MTTPATKKIAGAKSKTKESEINMLGGEVKELRLLLNGEDNEDNLNRKKRNSKNHTETHNF